MAETIRANINPALLTWARESIGMSLPIAAKKLQITLERLKSWEKGDLQPTIKQLQTCSNVYKRPLAAFFFKFPPSMPAELHDFRHQPSEVEDEKGPLVQLEIRRARQARKWYLEILNIEDEGNSSVNIRTRLSSNEENVSNRVREFLDIDLSEQFSWADSNKALRKWIDAIENHSVLVLQSSNIPSNVMRGFSIYYPTVPVIVLNGGEAPNGRIFTLLHEFAHLMLRRGGVCDTIEYRGVNTSNQRTEMYCNKLAAATLVPKDSLISKFISNQTGKIENWIDNVLEDAANKYCVSTQVILGRLHDLNYVEPKFYFRKLRDLIDAFNKAKESEPSLGSAPIYYPTKVRNLGYKYTRTVMTAHNSGMLSTLDACKYLDVKIKSLAGIEKIITGRR